MTTITHERPAEQPERVRWTRKRYDALVASGIFGDRCHIELIGGELLTEGMRDRMSQNPRHRWAVRNLQRTLEGLALDPYEIFSQSPFLTLEDGEPEPDVAVVPIVEDAYRLRHPSQAVLVVEVSDSTLRFDRTYKASLYAAAGIQDYWILNLVERQVEVYREPVASEDEPFGFRYASMEAFRAGDSVSPLAYPEARVDIAPLLP